MKSKQPNTNIQKNLKHEALKEIGFPAEIKYLANEMGIILEKDSQKVEYLLQLISSILLPKNYYKIACDDGSILYINSDDNTTSKIHPQMFKFRNIMNSLLKDLPNKNNDPSAQASENFIISKKDESNYSYLQAARQKREEKELLFSLANSTECLLNQKNYYENLYGAFLKNIPTSVSQTQEYKFQRPEIIVQTLQFLNIYINEQALFFLARAYLSLPLPQNWLMISNESGKEEFINQLTSEHVYVRPCYFYILNNIQKWRNKLKYDCYYHNAEAPEVKMTFLDEFMRPYVINMGEYVLAIVHGKKYKSKSERKGLHKTEKIVNADNFTQQEVNILKDVITNSNHSDAHYLELLNLIGYKEKADASPIIYQFIDEFVRKLHEKRYIFKPATKFYKQFWVDTLNGTTLNEYPHLNMLKEFIASKEKEMEQKNINFPQQNVEPKLKKYNAIYFKNRFINYEDIIKKGKIEYVNQAMENIKKEQQMMKIMLKKATSSDEFEKIKEELKNPINLKTFGDMLLRKLNSEEIINLLFQSGYDLACGLSQKSKIESKFLKNQSPSKVIKLITALSTIEDLTGIDFFGSLHNDDFVFEMLNDPDKILKIYEDLLAGNKLTFFEFLDGNRKFFHLNLNLINKYNSVKMESDSYLSEKIKKKLELKKKFRKAFGKLDKKKIAEFKRKSQANLGINFLQKHKNPVADQKSQKLLDEKNFKRLDLKKNTSIHTNSTNAEQGKLDGNKKIGVFAKNDYSKPNLRHTTSSDSNQLSHNNFLQAPAKSRGIKIFEKSLENFLGTSSTLNEILEEGEYGVDNKKKPQTFLTQLEIKKERKKFKNFTVNYKTSDTQDLEIKNSTNHPSYPNLSLKKPSVTVTSLSNISNEEFKDLSPLIMFKKPNNQISIGSPSLLYDKNDTNSDENNFMLNSNSNSNININNEKIDNQNKNLNSPIINKDSSSNPENFLSAEFSKNLPFQRTATESTISWAGISQVNSNQKMQQNFLSAKNEDYFAQKKNSKTSQNNFGSEYFCKTDADESDDSKSDRILFPSSFKTARAETDSFFNTLSGSQTDRISRRIKKESSSKNFRILQNRKTSEPLTKVHHIPAINIGDNLPDNSQKEIRCFSDKVIKKLIVICLMKCTAKSQSNFVLRQAIFKIIADKIFEELLVVWKKKSKLLLNQECLAEVFDNFLSLNKNMNNAKNKANIEIGKNKMESTLTHKRKSNREALINKSLKDSNFFKQNHGVQSFIENKECSAKYERSLIKIEPIPGLKPSDVSHLAWELGLGKKDIDLYYLVICFIRESFLPLDSLLQLSKPELILNKCFLKFEAVCSYFKLKKSKKGQSYKNSAGYLLPFLNENSQIYYVNFNTEINN